MKVNSAKIFQAGCSRLPAAGRWAFGILVGLLAAAHPSGCSRGPDLAGIYFLPTDERQTTWSIESLIELRDDGTAVMQTLSLHPSEQSRRDTKIETQSEGTWKLVGETVVYEGTLTTSSTLDGEKHRGNESIRLVFTLSSDGDLMLSPVDMDSDAIRYTKEPKNRSE